MKDSDTGLLLHKGDIERQRKYFKEMCKLLGIKVLFRSPKEDAKTWNRHGELDTFYNAPEDIYCIYEEHPKIYTMKKLGWDAELTEDVSIIHVPYDLKGIQKGALFIIPDAIDNSQGRVFRVVRMSTTQVYPDRIACEIAPEWENSTDNTQVNDFTSTNFNVLHEEDEEEGVMSL